MINTGMIFTSLVSLLVFVSAFLVAFTVFSKRKEFEKPMYAFSFFLMITGVLWFFVALRLFFAWLGFVSIDRGLFVFGQIFVFASGVPLAYYLSFRLFKKEQISKIVTFIFGLLFVATVFFLFWEGVFETERTYFASKFKVGEIGFFLFVCTIFPLIIAAFFDTIFGILKWMKYKVSGQPYYFLYSFVILFYLALGLFDEQGLMAGWGLVFFRLLFAAVFLFAYVVFQFHYQKKREIFADGHALTKKERIKEKKKLPVARRGVIFRKTLIILILLSLTPVVFSSFLIISSYNNALSVIEQIDPQASQLKQNVFIQISLVLFLLIILVLFAGVLITRSVTRPISALVRGVREVSGGNLNIQFKIKSKDELGELATVFNEMVIKIKEQRDREQLIGKLKTEFISIAAHQLRTPLSSVKWILKMLLEGDFGDLTEKQKEFTTKGYEANDRMIVLVNDLLDASRIEEGRFGFEFKLENLNEFLKNIVKTFEEQAKIRSIEIKLTLPKKSIMLVFDLQRLKMAVSNLIDNAIRYTNPGGMVTIAVENADGFSRILVKDTGVGIPERQKDRIFTKFFRADNVIRMQTEGTGLGLYLTKNIIEKHGGKIWFESGEREGTSFIFTLPHTQKI